MRVVISDTLNVIGQSTRKHLPSASKSEYDIFLFEGKGGLTSPDLEGST